MQLLLKSISIIKCGASAILVVSTMRRSFPGMPYASFQSTPAPIFPQTEITALGLGGRVGLGLWVREIDCDWDRRIRTAGVFLKLTPKVVNFGSLY